MTETTPLQYCMNCCRNAININSTESQERHMGECTICSPGVGHSTCQHKGRQPQPR